MAAQVKGLPALRIYRTSRKLTLEQMGDVFGVTGQTIWRWENGSRSPRRCDLPKISKLTKIPLSELLPSDASEAA